MKFKDHLGGARKAVISSSNKINCQDKTTTNNELHTAKSPFSRTILVHLKWVLCVGNLILHLRSRSLSITWCDYSTHEYQDKWNDAHSTQHFWTDKSIQMSEHCVRAHVCVCKLRKLLVCLLCNFCIFNNCCLSFKIYNNVLLCTVMWLMFSHILVSLMWAWCKLT